MTDWWPITEPDPITPLALALACHFSDGKSQSVDFRRSDGEHYSQITDDYFQTPDDLVELEHIALDTVTPAVIDIGAACGRFALSLQDQGIDVTAVDVCPVMTDLARRRGVEQTLTMDVFDLFSTPSAQHKRWNTACFLMETIGLVGTQERLFTLLNALHGGLGERAQVILDSAPLLETGETACVQLQIRYNNRAGPAFDWLYVDSSTLAQVAQAAGWQTELGYLDEATGHYLARLRRHADRN